jgi:LysM repeat protein
LDSLEVAGVDTSHIVEKADGTMVYMIQPGDTLTSISATLGYSVDELANFNQIRNVNLIYANSALRVPKGK